MDLTLLSLSIKVFEFEFSPLFLPFPPSHHSLSHFLCPFLLLSCSFGLLLLPHSLSHSLFPSLLNLSLFPVPSVSSFSPLSLSLPPSPSLSFLFPQFPHSPRSISHSPFLSPSLLHLSLSLSHYFPFSPFSQTLPFCSPSLSLSPRSLCLPICISLSLSPATSWGVCERALSWSTTKTSRYSRGKMWFMDTKPWGGKKT